MALLLVLMALLLGAGEAHRCKADAVYHCQERQAQLEQHEARLLPAISAISLPNPAMDHPPLGHPSTVEITIANAFLVMPYAPGPPPFLCRWPHMLIRPHTPQTICGQGALDHQVLHISGVQDFARSLGVLEGR